MRRILGRAAALALIAGLCATIPTAGATSRAHTAPALTLPAHADGLSRALASGRITPAKEALLRAQALFRPARVAAVYGPIARTGGDATMILRDLAVRLDGLTPSDRRAAHAILARPTDPFNATNNPDGWRWPRPPGRLTAARTSVSTGQRHRWRCPRLHRRDPGQRHSRLRRPGLGDRRARVEPGGRRDGLPGAAVGRDVDRPRPRRQARHLPQQPGHDVPVRLLHERRPRPGHADALTGVGLLRGRQQLHGADLPKPHPASEPEGDARPRVLPRRAVLVQHRRGHAG